MNHDDTYRPLYKTLIIYAAIALLAVAAAWAWWDLLAPEAPARPQLVTEQRYA